MVSWLLEIINDEAIQAPTCPSLKDTKYIRTDRQPEMDVIGLLGSIVMQPVQSHLGQTMVGSTSHLAQWLGTAPT
jgi:hypothetical protein